MIEYYLYRHLRLDVNPPVPFYIGIGTKQKGNTIKSVYHRAFSVSRNKEWHKIYNESNRKIEIELLYETDSLNEIEQKEYEFIALYGRKENGGLLVNLTDGGLGRAGSITPIEVREKLSKIHLGRKKGPMSDLTKAKLSESHKGKIPGSETRKKLSEAQIVRHKRKPYKHTEETKIKIGLKSLGNQHAKGWKPTPEQYNKMVTNRWKKHL